MANIFGKKHAIDNREWLGNCEGFSTLSQNFMNFGPSKTVKWDPHIYQTA